MVLTTSSAFLTAEPVAAGFFSFQEEYIESSERRNCLWKKKNIWGEREEVTSYKSTHMQH